MINNAHDLAQVLLLDHCLQFASVVLAALVAADDQAADVAALQLGGASFAALFAFGYYGLDYCANQLQNPFVADFGDAQLDGRFADAVCEDIDMLLLVRPVESPDECAVETGGDGDAFEAADTV